jgi:hypothetical protein
MRVQLAGLTACLVKTLRHPMACDSVVYAHVSFTKPGLSTEVSIGWDTDTKTQGSVPTLEGTVWVVWVPSWGVSKGNFSEARQLPDVRL